MCITNSLSLTTIRTTAGKFILILITILLASCGEGEMADLKKYVDDTNGRKNNNVPPLPEFKHIPSYFYEVGNLRDPFIPFMEAQGPSVSITGQLPGTDETGGNKPDCPRPDPHRVRAGLELMPIDSLKMVGTLEEGKVVWGLVIASDGTIYRVQPGDYLGQNSGKVVNIDDNKIELIELIPDKQGCWTETLTTLPLSS
jgi:type IV pilus assembly protein PilP